YSCFLSFVVFSFVGSNLFACSLFLSNSSCDLYSLTYGIKEQLQLVCNGNSFSSIYGNSSDSESNENTMSLYGAQSSHVGVLPVTSTRYTSFSLYLCAIPFAFARFRFVLVTVSA